MRLSERTLLSGLKSGVKNTRHLMDHATDFHGTAVQTEYLLTSDIAREFIQRSVQVKVECLNRALVSSATARSGTSKVRKRKLGTKRTDIALVNEYVPLAMIEIKIGVGRLTGVSMDLKKIITSMRLMDAKYASRVVGVSVFQVHLPTTKHRYEKKHFVSAIGKIEHRFNLDLKAFARSRPDFKLTLKSLQAVDEGYVEQEIEADFDGEPMIGRPGHVTRYYAILLRSKQKAPPTPTTIEALKRRDVAGPSRRAMRRYRVRWN
jgi:hypothetical protein